MTETPVPAPRYRGGGLGILAALAAGFVVSSGLNWAIAAYVLNPWAEPLFDGFLRSGGQAGGAAILRMSVGFMVPLAVVCALTMVLPRPGDWRGRALVATGLVGLAGFFGTYTFLSGWGNVAWWPLMGAALADTVSLLVGALVFGAIACR